MHDVLITHPGRQYSGESAIALHLAGSLAGYWAGVPCLEQHRNLVPAWIWDRYIHYDLLDLPPDRVRCWPWAPLIRHVTRRALPSAIAAHADFAVCRLFDGWAAQRLRGMVAKCLVGCEISALDSFRAAKGVGMVALLDAASLHHSVQDALHGHSESAALHRRITAVKDAEIALADGIITCSDIARDSYLAAGVPSGKVVAVPLGANLNRFAPVEGEDRRRGPIRFAFSGSMILRKGFDLVIEAFAALRSAMPGVELLIMGPRGDAADFLDRVDRAGINVTGMLTQATLAQHLRDADCLLLPSRNDSYGMAVAEALASGIPAVVSTMVGAKSLVHEDESGWIIPVGDGEALLARMRWCAENPAAVRGMRYACRNASLQAGWDAYHRRYARTVSELASLNLRS